MFRENQSNIQNLLSEFVQQSVAQIDFNQNAPPEFFKIEFIEDEFKELNVFLQIHKQKLMY
jgi:hypothetical protein